MDIYGSQKTHPMIKPEAIAFLVYADKELLTPIAVNFEDAEQLRDLVSDLSPTTNVEILGVHEFEPALADSGEGQSPSLLPLAGHAVCPQCGAEVPKGTIS